MTSQTDGKAAILIVNGGAGAESNRWIRLCLDKIAAWTDYENYHIYVWNNRVEDENLAAWLQQQPRLTMIAAAPYEKLNHPHRTPLQRLYHLARQEGATYIVTMDSDAHPLKPGWLTTLLRALDDGAALAGVWRDELSAAIQPYVHPSCLCTTVDFVEQHCLRFDFNSSDSIEKNDTLSDWTRVAESVSAPIYRLPRSNRNNFHYLMGGIYGDLIYHHGAASRENVSFHGEVRSQEQNQGNLLVRDRVADLLFAGYDQYMSWLQGQQTDPAFEQKITRLPHQNAGITTWTKWRQRIRFGQWRRQIYRKLNKQPLVRKAVNLVRRYVTRRNRPGQPRRSEAMIGPFTRPMLNLLPFGWRAEGPDFVGIGAPKSGTTWWYTLLSDHPQIVPNCIKWDKRKELQYFAHFQHRPLTGEEIAVYRQAFASPPGAVCGEFSVQYLSYPHCIEHLAVVASNAKILVILRNPIDRLMSHLNHLTVNRLRPYQRLNPGQIYVFRTFSLYTEATLHSLYSIGLERLFRHYNREQVLVWQYEYMVRFPDETLRRTYRFLGVDERYRPQKIAAPVNVHPYLIPKPTPEERSQLATYLADDVRRVFALCPELDRTLWPDFDH